MSFIVKSEYPLSITVSLEDDNFTLHTRALCENTLQELIKKAPQDTADAFLCEQIITGWENLLDTKKSPLPFHKKNLSQLLAHPFIRRAILSAYWKALYQDRQKN